MISKMHHLDSRFSTQCYPVSGFTLIELVVVVAVAGILLSITLPGFSRMALDSRRTTAINDLIRTFNYARSEAISTRGNVEVCRSSNATGSKPACTIDPGGWEKGWIVFRDEDCNGARDEDEPLLRQHESLTAGATLHGNSKLADSVSFDGHGGTFDNGRLVYCDRRGWSDDVHIVVVATTGRIRVTTASQDKNTPLNSCLS